MKQRFQAIIARIFVLLCAALLNLVSAGPSLTTEYRFTLDGEAITPEITPVFGDTDSPAPGDLVKVGDFLMVLGEAGNHDFRRDGKDRMLGKLPGMDAEACVAVKIRKTLGKNDEWIQIDPLSPMTNAEKAQLRGVFINDPPDDLDVALAGVRWEHTALTVDYGIVKNDTEVLPPLPEGLRYLDFELTMTPSIRDVRTLKSQSKLVYLSLGRRIDLDLNLLTCGPELRFFDIAGAKLTHFDAIAGWAAIRNLSLRHCEELSDIEFLRGLGELRILNLSWNRNLKDIGSISTLSKLTDLNISSWGITDLKPVAGLTNLKHLSIGGTQVTDLSPIGGLQKLRTLDTNRSAVTIFPSSPVLPNLERATLLMTPVSPEAVEAFQSHVPNCKIHHTLKAALLSELAGADRMRARTGGTCHRRIAQEKTIFEIKGTGQVREFLQGIKLVEPEGIGACMCCGNPSFEIYRGQKLLTTIGFHHSISLRWDDGWWPGDIALTKASTEYLCNLLAEHGHGFPLAEHEKRMRRQAAYERHRAACLKFITAEQFDAWLEAFRQGEEVDLTKLVKNALPDAEDYTATIYSLYGALPDNPWHTSQYFDRVPEALLEAADPAALNTILTRADCPDPVLQGVARRGFNGWSDGIAKALPDPQFEKLANWALRHPSEYNRRLTIADLAAMKTKRANRIIVRFLRDCPPPRAPEASVGAAPEQKLYEYSDPNDIASIDPFATEPPEPAPDPVPLAFIPPDGISEPVAAVLLLAQHGYPDARSEIRKLEAKTEGEERKILGNAAAILATPVTK